MKSIEISGPNGVTARVSGAATSSRAGEQAPLPRNEQVASESAALSVALAGPSAPIDADRVAEIRRAIETGSYPVLPVRVADAMSALLKLRAPGCLVISINELPAAQPIEVIAVIGGDQEQPRALSEAPTHEIEREALAA